MAPVTHSPAMASSAGEGRIAELERKVGQQTLEIDFLKGCLQRIEEQRMLQALTGNPRSTGKSKKK
jgi:transposase